MRLRSLGYLHNAAPSDNRSCSRTDYGAYALVRNYAEMAYLMVPRPFMVERGHPDRVGRDQWVAHEYTKVRWLYAQLGLADRTEIEFFQGGHSINGQGTFDFQHRHLNWPNP